LALDVPVLYRIVSIVEHSVAAFDSEHVTVDGIRVTHFLS
jgi:hypothetical protein